jgi:hypothetical protein
MKKLNSTKVGYIFGAKKNKKLDLATEPTKVTLYVRLLTRPWRGAVDIASASGTRRPGFEPLQGIRFLGKHSSAVVCL